MACLVGLNILYTGGKLIYESFNHLMDTSDPQLLEQIARLLEKNRRPDWIDVHQLRAWRAGAMIHIDLHLVLPEHLSLDKAHHEAKILEGMLIDAFRENADVLVHMDPCGLDECPICNRVACGQRGRDQKSTETWSWEKLIRAPAIKSRGDKGAH